MSLPESVQPPRPGRPVIWQPFHFVAMDDDSRPHLAQTLRGKNCVDISRDCILAAITQAVITLRLRKAAQ